MPRVSLEAKNMDNTHFGLAGVMLVAVLVAFDYWCYYVNERRKNHPYSPETPSDEKISMDWQDTSFQAAVVGFLLIITVKHLRDLVYHM